ncbi:nuclear transport factor 2 family protein [Oerskovia turbata]|uniref:Nuclear transport factor 2 family protein n=1 Tax=Oerskovia turbata TaxID=1713 RepID=A0A4Q1KXW0_9CELL|nr:nuclear transport factor 2 family protein [Oerskovia turbata]RXR25055.1 nuclear transport factor 2 family protein [Oerskovia turbata]RXR35201.1 nuclear transport factor 2 family protein [Oerskovia turbata]TGJ96442.1 nuclear transport factor 2 family protein [Actinotalea fermentans ATCC 43279 = JCM 9966 = DSM 3133]
MDRESVMTWVAAYEAAWRGEDRGAVASLFTEDATYARSPYDDPLRGHDAIRDFWLADAGETFTMTAQPVAVDGLAAVVRVEVRYAGPRPQEYRDLWILRFADDGRVADFAEWAYWPSKPDTASGGTPSA